MIKDNFPKILIFGAPFNNFSGGGITLSNLFRGWPKDKIACTATGHVLVDVSTDVCDVFYRLGTDEQRWRFPLNFVQRSFASGLMSFVKSTIGSDQEGKRIRIRQVLVDKVFYPIIHWLGLFHALSEIHFSENFKNWLDTYKPDVLYLQVSSREEILFALALYDYLGKPAIIHMMDDWPSSISKYGLLKNYWRTKIDREFRRLLDRMDLFLSISDAMSSAYKIRYNKVFIPFHNPIDISKYKQITEIDSAVSKTFRILYIGRLGLANMKAISSFGNAVSHFNSEKYNVELVIVTPSTNSKYLKKLCSLRNVKVLPPVAHEKVPDLLTQYDLLLLPLDFTRLGFKFAQYSMPTKASEYMISGIPIIIFAPKETAISKFCQENECGYCITENTEESIIAALNFLIDNVEYRTRTGLNAVRLATKLFDMYKVRDEFQQLLIKIAKHNVLK
jgi:glycosyltransferase involved in cell wall biosynthesis